MKIYIIRHAQGLHNVNGDYSIYDPALTPEGFNQCNNVKDNFKDVEMIFSSTAVRTLQTASTIFPNKIIYATDLLLEYNTGIPCNSRNDLVKQAEYFPHVNFEAYRVKPLEKEVTWQDGDIRAKKFESILRLLDYDTIAIVSHCNFILNLAPILGHTDTKHLDNADHIVVHI
tara:strand:+ start:491 stop:1006 length:516 start_codon:yes stop_codon:yes gene_type:complete